MSILLLRVYLKQTYRGIRQVMELMPALRKTLGLDRLPRHTTIAEFAQREATPELIAELMSELVTLLKESGVLEADAAGDVAIDSTGLENSRASAHFISRRGTKATHYTKLSLAVMCGTLIAVAAVASQGPGNDLVEARPLLWQLSGNLHPSALYADKGYDAEWVHAFCRHGMETRSYIPPIVRTNDGSIKSPLRSLMSKLPSSYGRRWHAESFFSAMKRMFGAKLTSLSQPMREREALLKALAYSLHR